MSLSYACVMISSCDAVVTIILYEVWWCMNYVVRCGIWVMMMYGLRCLMMYAVYIYFDEWRTWYVWCILWQYDEYDDSFILIFFFPLFIIFSKSYFFFFYLICFSIFVNVFFFSLLILFSKSVFLFSHLNLFSNFPPFLSIYFFSFFLSVIEYSSPFYLNFFDRILIYNSKSK